MKINVRNAMRCLGEQQYRGGANDDFAYLWFVGLPCCAKSGDGVPLNAKKEKNGMIPVAKGMSP